MPQSLVSSGSNVCSVANPRSVRSIAASESMLYHRRHATCPSLIPKQLTCCCFVLVCDSMQRCRRPFFADWPFSARLPFCFHWCFFFTRLKVMENNPQIRHILSDPAVLRQYVDMALNPDVRGGGSLVVMR